MTQCSPHSTARVGAYGEEVALRYLRSLGYAVRAMNERVAHDEIDIIAFDPAEKSLIFAEVKTRASFDQDFPPQLNLTPAKCACLRRSARAWVADHAYEGSYRIDLLCVAAGRVVEHIKEIAEICE